MNKTQKITILGAGISGITTGVVLQLMGYDTQIIAKERADRPQNPEDPAFASLYPSASVIPHSVFGDDILSLFDDSQRIFQLLMEEQVKGLSVNQHFEVFEYAKEISSYATAVKNFRPLAQPWQSEEYIPHYPETGQLWGWSFDCFFADWPVYLPQLFEWYEQLGGVFTIKTLVPGEIQQLTSPIVNCTGLAGYHLFEDSERNVVILKGHIVHVEDAPEIRNKLGQSISYNYNPTPQTYADAEGNTQDVYCYPRSDGWIIGGSRLQGTMDNNGKWTGIETGADRYKINGNSVPAPIIELNMRILNHSYHVDLDKYRNRKAVVGYRYIRNPEDGLRLEKAEESDMLMIHNYGHGGAGVTLSWGCALRVAKLVAEEIPIPNRSSRRLSPRLNNIQTELATIFQEKYPRLA